MAAARVGDIPRARSPRTVGASAAAAIRATSSEAVTDERLIAMDAMTSPNATLTRTRQPIAASRSNQGGTMSQSSSNDAATARTLVSCHPVCHAGCPADPSSRRSAGRMAGPRWGTLTSLASARASDGGR